MSKIIARSAIAVLVVGAVVGMAMAMRSTPAQQNDQAPLIVTTLFPLEDWARMLGGSAIRVVNIVPDGVEPHDYEPTADDLRLLADAALVVSVGEGFDDHLTEQLSPEKVLTFLATVEAMAAEHDEHDEDGHGHEELAFDPHVWLDVERAEDMVIQMGNALSAFAPQATVNAETYAEQLRALDGLYAQSLATCETRNIIVTHDAFSYLAQRYQLEAHPIMGLSPEGEPNANTLSHLADEARTLGVTTVFFETLADPSTAETLAREVGLTTAVLDPLEGVTSKARRAGATYLGIMEQNRQALHTALRCL